MNKTTQPKNRIIQFLMIFVGVSGCFSVLFGAWLAHGGQVLPINVQSSLHTALRYQLFHTLALMATLVWLISSPVKVSSKILLSAAIGFFVGILCFSGTIYIKTFFSFPLVGKLTPFGGISLAIAWLLLSVEGKKNL
jgi:uncharacterized membrane protein YgdD (TMEM256/DUF423 family)